MDNRKGKGNEILDITSCAMDFEEGKKGLLFCIGALDYGEFDTMVTHAENILNRYGYMLLDMKPDPKPPKGYGGRWFIIETNYPWNRFLALSNISLE